MDVVTLAQARADLAKFHPPVVANSFFHNGVALRTDVAAAPAHERFRGGAMPLFRRQRFDRIGTRVHTAGSAGALLRLGIFTPEGVLVVDGGTVEVETTGIKLATIDVTLNPGLYIVGAVHQGTSSSALRLYGCTASTLANAALPFGVIANEFASGGGYAGDSTISGALPSTLALTASASGNALPACILRAVV